MSKASIILGVNSSWNVINFRMPLIKSLKAAGYRVIIASPKDGWEHEIISSGFEHVPLNVDSQGVNPFADLCLFFRYLVIFAKFRPGYFLGYTIKPNIYGSIAASVFGVSVINNIAGLGSVFISESWRTRLASRMYQIALMRSQKVFFQNPDDLIYFVEQRIVDPAIVDLLPGSGVDLKHFSASGFCASPQKPKARFRFLLVSRVLIDKGVREFAGAAKIMAIDRPDVEFCILGGYDPKNPNTIPIAEFLEWQSWSNFKYLGATTDVRQHIFDADCIVLPSYREGLPRALLEAAALERPIICTDVPGCREVIDADVTGYLCEVKSVESLVFAMSKILNLDSDLLRAMGESGRKRVEMRFSVDFVVEKYLAALKSV